MLVARALLVVCLVFGACRSDDGEPVRPAATPSTDRSTVTRVIDGDTIEVRIGGRVERVRIIGINAAEEGECLATAATEWLRDRVADREVTLVADTTDRDGFGRLLRYVEVDGTDVGTGLVGAGLALAREYPPDTARSDALVAAQDAARDAEVGMWASAACGPTEAGAADVAIRDVRFDADGDDTTNLNDEWVRIVNEGAEPVPLDGWVLKDETATHRYPFPARFVLAPGADVTVRSGCGIDDDDELFWCVSGSAVWNNDGDTAFLLDPAGNVVSTLAS